MKAVFGDTYYFLGLLNKSDDAHKKCLDYLATFDGISVTTEWVMLELADGLATSRRRDIFEKTRQELLSDTNAKIIPLTMEMYEKGIALYAGRPDKNWSLTDCISFAVMKREGITEALTGDNHFEQAGFIALMK